MPARTSYLQGTPNWVDLQTTDTAAAKAFYGGLLGWTFEDSPMPDGQVYSMAKVGDAQVAARKRPSRLARFDDETAVDRNVIDAVKELKAFACATRTGSFNRSHT